MGPKPSSISPVPRLPMRVGPNLASGCSQKVGPFDSSAGRSPVPLFFETPYVAQRLRYWLLRGRRRSYAGRGGRAGQGFLADLSFAWEAEALRAEEFGVRVVMLRTGMVLEQDGGALPKMLLPFRLFAGGPIMPGTQWVSWIHRHDHIGLVQWALTTPSVSGPVNAVAPEAVTMKRFCEVLGRVLHRPSWLPVPGFALRVALGELGTLMTTGQRVNPAKALSGGYVFHYPTLEPALRAIMRKG